MIDESASGHFAGVPPITPHKSAKRSGTSGLCLLSAVLCFAAQVFLLRLYRLDFTVPFAYQGDSVYFCVWVKGLLQGMSNSYNTNLGMPSGANWLDFPVNLTMETGLVRVLSFFTKQPGLVLNLVWLAGTAATSGICTYCFVRLGIARSAAIILGVLYALQPFTFFRQEHHLNLMFYCVPLLATGAIEILGTSPLKPSQHPGAPNLRGRLGHICLFSKTYGYLWIGCLIQGLSYIYFTFFAIFLFLVAGLCSLFGSRRKHSILICLSAITIAGGATLLNLLPSVKYWFQHGRNVSMAYKSPSETEYYGLKIRQLLTPTLENPVRPLRRISETVVNSGVFEQNEASTAKLGAIGSVGLLLLLAGIGGCCISSDFRVRWAANAFGPSALLTLSCLLLATVGGFAVFFSIFVSPDIRAYNRIVTFIEFFSLVPIGLLLTKLRSRLQSSRSIAAYMCGIFLFFCFGLMDQASTGAITQDSERNAKFYADAEFVRTLEERLPPKAMIFQLPYTPFPLDPGTQRLPPYEHGSAYIHSSTLRWSWGGIAGRSPDEWVRAASHLEAPRLVEHLSNAGFAGLWIDRRGYPLGDISEVAIQQIGAPTLVRKDGLIAFYDLRELSRLARASQSLPMSFTSGFYDLESFGTKTWRWSMKRSTITVKNSLPRARRVEVSFSILGGAPARQSLIISTQAHSETLTIDPSPRSYMATLIVPPNGSADILLDCRCSRTVTPTDPRSMYFQVIRPKIEEVK